MTEERIIEIARKGLPQTGDNGENKTVQVVIPEEPEDEDEVDPEETEVVYEVSFIYAGNKDVGKWVFKSIEQVDETWD